jgi:hypothetical protein
MADKIPAPVAQLHAELTDAQRKLLRRAIGSRTLTRSLLMDLDALEATE